MNLKNLKDGELLERLKALVRAERECVADVVAHLAELDDRELAIKLAFPSLFAYCVRELGYTEAAAYYRIRAARAARRLPQVLEMLRTGAISLETIVRLNPHLERPDAAELLESAKGKSTREVEEMAARIAPREKRDFARVISVSRPADVRPQNDADSLFSVSLANTPAAVVEKRAPEIKKVHVSFVTDEDTFLLLRRAQEILRHKYPAGRFEDIFRDALIALLMKKDPDRRLLGKTGKT